MSERRVGVVLGGAGDGLDEHVGASLCDRLTVGEGSFADAAVDELVERTAEQRRHHRGWSATGRDVWSSSRS